jgi:glycosyltransferase involved in cell wall biosynthesis
MGIETAPLRSFEPEQPAASAVAGRALGTLQIGMRWFGSGSGGLDRVFFDLTNALPDQGIGVRGLVVEPANAAAMTNGKIQAFAKGGAGLPRRLWNARRAISQSIASGDVDLVAAHFALYASPALDHLRRKPLVVHFHGPWARESDAEGQSSIAVSVKKAVEQRVYRHADRFIVLSQAFAELLAENYRVDPKKISVVSGSVDLQRFNPEISRKEARVRLGWPVDRPILFSARRLAARMGLDRLIAAMTEVIRRQPDVILYIAGRGPLEPMLQRQINESGLRNHVHLLGFISDNTLPIAYRAANINVVPTVALEGFGLTTAEALAAGTPSMVTPVGGLPEVVSDLSTDLVFPSSGVAEIATGLTDALSGALILPTSAACRAYAETRFSTPLAAMRTAAIYRELA